MENNEDKRQYTVITAEIERQKIELEKHRSLKNILNHVTLQLQSMKRVVECEYAISVLESLLPKERENLMSAYIDGTGYVINGGVPKKAWFRNKYKPYEK